MFLSAQNSMEDRRRENNSGSSGEIFSFPAITTPPEKEYSDDQFEFGCVTTEPGSPNSPADRLFSNGKLLPHVFPVQNNFSYSRSTSRTSSRESLMSSRSNSTNSRSSNCSSARTSTSEISERNRVPPSSPGDGNLQGRIPARRERNNRPVLSSNYQYRSPSKRWQFIASAPVLKHQGSRSRRVEHVLDRKGSKKSGGEEQDGGEEKSWFGRRILKSFVSACKECHAIKTANVEGGFSN